MNCRPVAGILGLISNILILWALVSPRWSTSLPITTSGQPIRVGFWKFSKLLLKIRNSRTITDRHGSLKICWKLRTLQSITAYRGLWKQCYGQGGTAGDFNTECNKYTQGIAELARSGLVGQRALVCLSFIFCFFGLISGTASTEAVNLAKSKKSKNKSAGKVISLSHNLWLRKMTH